VLDGAGTFRVAGEDIAVGAGDYLRVDATATRQALAGPDGMRFLVIGAQPNSAYDGRESL
jgi:quercetin dioxygenase-like cupin family protein